MEFLLLSCNNIFAKENNLYFQHFSDFMSFRVINLLALCKKTGYCQLICQSCSEYTKLLDEDDKTPQGELCFLFKMVRYMVR